VSPAGACHVKAGRRIGRKESTQAKSRQKKGLRIRHQQGRRQDGEASRGARGGQGPLGTRVDVRLSYWNHCVSSTGALNSLATPVRPPSSTGATAPKETGSGRTADGETSRVPGDAHVQPQPASTPLDQGLRQGKRDQGHWRGRVPLAGRGYTPPPPSGWGHRRDSATGHPRAQERISAWGTKAHRGKPCAQATAEISPPGKGGPLGPPTLRHSSSLCYSTSREQSPSGRAADASPPPSAEGRCAASLQTGARQCCPLLQEGAQGGSRPGAGGTRVVYPGCYTQELGGKKGLGPGQALPLRSCHEWDPHGEATGGGGTRVVHLGWEPQGRQARGWGRPQVCRSGARGVEFPGEPGGGPPSPRLLASTPEAETHPAPVEATAALTLTLPVKSTRARVHRTSTTVGSSMTASSLTLGSISSSSTSSSVSRHCGVRSPNSHAGVSALSQHHRSCQFNPSLGGQGPGTQETQQRLNTARTGSRGGRGPSSGFLRGGSCSGYSDASCGTLASCSDTSGLSRMSRSGTFSSTSAGSALSPALCGGAAAWDQAGAPQGSTPGRTLAGPWGSGSAHCTAGRPAPSSLALGERFRQRFFGRVTLAASPVSWLSLDPPRLEPHSPSDQTTPSHATARLLLGSHLGYRHRFRGGT